jgi:hypothetical protein
MKFVRAQMAQGIAPPSIVRNMLEEASPEDQLVQDTIRDLGAVAYIGASVDVLMHIPVVDVSSSAIAGADTTSALVLAFFIAMLRYPDAQKAGQKEIDGFLGSRLPTFEDKDTLPYVNAVMLETLRWIPAIPGGQSSVISPSSCLSIAFKVFHTLRLRMTLTKGTSSPRVLSCSASHGTHILLSSLWYPH